jgi:glycine/D-amino acid oxidase-like deaminating enzyme
MGDTSRRAFLRQLAATAAAAAAAPITPAALHAFGASAPGAPAPSAPALHGLTRKGRVIAGGFADTDQAVGHALRDGRIPTSASVPVRRTRVAIVGGGVSGLSAGWHLDALGERDWLLLELAPEVGGNARAGRNATSAYPWGAHYLPLPAPDAVHVRALLREVGVLHDDGTFDERTLCHAPQERVFQHGTWHEGLEPLDAAPGWELAEWKRFDAQVAAWRESGAFRVPLAGAPFRGDGARATHALDTVTADAWLRTNGYRSPTLRWWLEYGTRDDYGTSLSQVSAWAAAHYFAGRPADEGGPLTWPEGNAFLVRHLAERAGDRLVHSAPTVSLERVGARWRVRTPRAVVECDAVIWAAPLFVLPRVLPGTTLPVTTEYAPWVVANLTLDRRPKERGAPPAWDNVLYGSASLGYVSATHQSVAQPRDATVWTWYHAVVDRPAKDARTWLEQRPWSAWRDEILADLARAHPDVAECVTRLDVWRWGHAMARPLPGLLARTATLADWRPAPGVFVAHADVSGFSIFEEAQWQGVRAAERAARTLGGD